ncbi:MAG TPA: substrate-binding domain-containing protein [Flavisolibacter sp.]|jgi:phosphate transport system substrate-binding protein|nr:substrate-binding domain-containing protein [Flavisolibacter sp.]
MNKIVRLQFFSLLLFFGLAGCKNEAAPTENDRFDSGTLYISCDESFKPVMDAEVQVYRNDYPKADIIVKYKPEADCLRDFLVDSVRMIIATRGPSAREKALIADSLKLMVQSQTVAYDAIAVVVHPEAPDSMFTVQEIRSLLSGKSNKNLIPVLDGVKATSTVRFMLDSVLRGQSLGANVTAAQNSVDVINYVARTKAAVGFIGIGWVGNTDDTAQLSYLKKVKLARLESTDSSGGYVWPVQYLIYTKTYPLIRDLVYVLKERESRLARNFANFLQAQRGQLIFRRAYLFPAIIPSYARDARLE